MVGETKRQHGRATFCQPFTRAAVRYFDQVDAAAARKWLNEASRRSATTTNDISPGTPAANPQLMKIQINTGQNIDGHEVLARQAEFTVENALGHLAEHITRVEVHLSDENGGKDGSRDKRCLMEARFEGRPPIAVTHKSGTAVQAVAGAAEKLKQALGHAIDRRNPPSRSAAIVRVIGRLGALPGRGLSSALPLALLLGRPAPFMTTPNHDEISLQAQQLWRDRGCPAGRDTEIWFEAERNLRDGPAADIFAARARAETAAASEVEYHRSPAQSKPQSIEAAMQRDGARARQIPHHTGPKPKPIESGKPLWSRPHSS